MEIDINKEGLHEFRKVFVPVIFRTEDGQELSICMRDDGFEIKSNGANLYYVKDGKVSLSDPQSFPMMLPKDRASTHPGFFIKQDIIEELGFTEEQLANHLGIDQEELSRIVDGKSQITTGIALHLAEITNTTEEFWVYLQQLHNAYLHHICGHPMGKEGCVICKGSNDIGEICEKCAEDKGIIPT